MSSCQYHSLGVPLDENTNTPYRPRNCAEGMVAAINPPESGNHTYAQYQASCNPIISSQPEIELSYLLFLACNNPGERKSHVRIPHNFKSLWLPIPHINRLDNNDVAWGRDLTFYHFSSYRNHVWYHGSRSGHLGIMNRYFLSMHVL